MLFLADGLDQVDASLLKQVMLILAWVASVGGAVFGGRWLGKKGTKENPVAIEQPLNVQKHDAAARKSEVEKIDASMRKLGERVDSLAEQINAQFAAMTKAGQDRAAAITQNIDEEIGTLQHKIGELAEALHEKINKALVTDAKHDADIENLKTQEFRHNSEIARIQEHIADLLARPKR